jgi:hypothetical protein
MEIKYEEILEFYKQELADKQQEVIILKLQVKKLQEQKELPKEE